MAFGFPPKYSGKINLNLRIEDASDLVEETFKHLGWKYSIEGPGRFSGWAKSVTDMDRGSHPVSVVVNEYEGLEVTSSNIFPWPFFDFGVHKETVEAFIEVFSMKTLDREPRFSDSLPHGGRSEKTVVENND